jgi:hypothetical protein
MAIARIAHPRFSDDFQRYVFEDELFTKPTGYSLDKTPEGVILYEGNIKLPSET